ncbi:MAG: hypothetical protein MMC23_002710 [Stictis urceolatum]|nr:hypothetical protein [Stictis urceolata]
MPLPESVQTNIDGTKVDYVRLGKSGLRVSVPILGAMSFGSKSWTPWMIEEAKALPILKRAYESGLNTWDTADMYSNGLSEAIIGKAIKQFDIPRQKIVLMTKVFYPIGDDPSLFGPMYADQLFSSKEFVNQGGLSRGAILRAVDASLKRLGTDYIDLLQIHRLDTTVPPEEIMKALHDLVQSGKVHYIGASSMWTYQFAQLQFVAEKNGWTKFVSMQNNYSLLYREEEREMNKFCKETGVGIIPWSPLFGGKLARPIDAKTPRSTAPSPMAITFSEADTTVVQRVEELAKKKGWQMNQVALAWLKKQGAVPITGLNKVERVDEACELKGKELTDEDAKYLEEPYLPKPIMGHH